MFIIECNVLDEIINHARGGAPEEVCGLVGGRNNTAHSSYVVENQLHSPIEYFMDPRNQMESFKTIIRDGFELVALYHSHPESPPQPSKTDLARAYQTDIRYMILSLVNPIKPELRCYTCQDGNLVEEAWNFVSKR